MRAEYLAQAKILPKEKNITHHLLPMSLTGKKPRKKFKLLVDPFVQKYFLRTNWQLPTSNYLSKSHTSDGNFIEATIKSRKKTDKYEVSKSGRKWKEAPLNHVKILRNADKNYTCPKKKKKKLPQHKKINLKSPSKSSAETN